MSKRVPMKSKTDHWYRSRITAWVHLLMVPTLAVVLYGRVLSGDVWWHLKTGQWIVTHRAFPFVDQFSYTVHTPIVFQEWGAEVIFWLIYRYISPSALAILTVMLVSTAMLIAFRMALARSGNAFASFVVVAVGAAASAGSVEMRPQVFAFLFFALTVLILQRFHEKGGRSVWLLAPLTLLWANFHGSFVLVVALIVIDAILSILAPPAWANESSRSRVVVPKQLLTVGVLAGVLALINPNGFDLYRYPVKVILNPNVSMISEWTAPTFREWIGGSLLVFVGLAAIGLALVRDRLTLRDFVYVSLFTVASLLARRNAVLLVIACSAPVALWFSYTLDRITQRLTVHRRVVPARATAWGVLIAAVGIALACRVYDARGRSAFDYMNCTEIFPAAACDFILSKRIAGPMFNDFNYGGYLIWRLWPRYRVFVDGRTEPYLDGVIRESFASVGGQPGAWRDVFERYGIKFAVLNPGAPLVSVLSERKDWVCAYRDDIAVIFIYNNPKDSEVTRDSAYR